MNYLFLDTESTGRAMSNCKLLEVAGFFVNSLLEKKDSFSVIINPQNAFWEQEALRMHKHTGLLDQCENGVLEQQAKTMFESFVNKYLKSCHPEDRKIYLAGNSVWADKYMLCTAWGIEFLDNLLGTHQIIDVSSVSLTFKDQFGIDCHNLLDKKFLLNYKKHRAMHDALYSYELYKAMVNARRGA
jgi:oligoribonuclease (3'-5' exoribonuclease)